ncbi:MAG: hypothetical protein IJ394_01950 [Bacteroidales bacterium]|nr:hypothetical protein [Bacteroidales bacterium]
MEDILDKAVADIRAIAATGQWPLEAQVRAYDLFDMLSENSARLEHLFDAEGLEIRPAAENRDMGVGNVVLKSYICVC